MKNCWQEWVQIVLQEMQLIDLSQNESSSLTMQSYTCYAEVSSIVFTGTYSQERLQTDAPTHFSAGLKSCSQKMMG